MIKSILFLFAVFVLTVVTCKVDSSWDVEKAFKENEITPGRSIEGRLPLKVPPKKFLTVFFPNGVKVGLGNNLEPEQVQEKPIVTWDAEEGAYYTLFQIDLDPPSRKFACLGEFRHWLVVNIPGNDVNKGKEVVKYRGSAPTIGSGYHRYVFLVYKQPGIIKCNETFDFNDFHNRAKSSTCEFANKYHLGDPVFGSFYNCKKD